MREEYQKAFAQLNDKQREAVEQIYGPVLVIAGPGTGKTQLISTRAGYILENTDATPSDILALTFTNAGVAEMRERLIKLIGQEAYGINLYTYHAFGGEILRRYPQYFDDEQLEPIDDLRKDVILRGLIAKLPYSDPLKYADNYLRDVVDLISDAKQSLLTPNDLTAIAQANLGQIVEINSAAADVFAGLSRVSPKAVPTFEKLLQIVKKVKPAELPKSVKPLADYAASELADALDSFNETSKTTGLSEWKKKWLEKNAHGDFIFSGQASNEKLAAAAGLYERYQAVLKQEKFYDYDDMILRAIAALEAHPELKYSLAEQFQFIMLDEFQDTNPAQLRLVELMSDHPVHEGRPNILAVGDDDQAIYAFQGADHANMAHFARAYKDVKVVSLEENWRSKAEILELSKNIAEQIEQRLHHNFPGVQKILKAANQDLPPAFICAREFKSDAAEYGWVAGEIKRLSDQEKIPASDIAVLAPKHKYLRPLLPFLAAEGLSVHYEKRENILDAPIVIQLVQMSRLLLALGKGDEAQAAELWPEILSYGFWGLPTDKIWRLSWKTRSERKPWTDLLFDDKDTRPIADFLLKLSGLAKTTPLEQILDALLGLPGASQNLKLKFVSPLYAESFDVRAITAQPLDFAELATDLSILRFRLREWGRSHEGPLLLESFVEFVEGHRAANLNILNESPYHQAEEAVNLLTAYGAKGREFRAVFIIGCLDDVWGSASRNQGSRVGLPANLGFIRYQGASEDERLRLLFVAATRAKTHLYLTAYRQTLAGKPTSRLKYLDVIEAKDGPTSNILPAAFNKIISDKSEVLPPSAAESYWTTRHLPPFKPSLRAVLAPQLARYQLSATDLNNFIDLERAGPDIFFLKAILGFPEAPSQTAIYGTAIHDTLKWLGGELKVNGKLPERERTLAHFNRLLAGYHLPAQQQELLEAKGQTSLTAWLDSRSGSLKPNDVYEHNFRDEGVLIGKAHLGGKVDRLVINEKNRTIQVYDYKTGKPFERWQGSETKRHKFKQQLMFYKLLVENSTRFKGYRVERGFIEFVEAEDQQLVLLELEFDDKEIEEFKRLIAAIWRHLQKLDLPDVSEYPATLSGIRKFEQDLIAGQ